MAIMALRQGMTQQIVEQPRSRRALGGWDTSSLQDFTATEPESASNNLLPFQHVFLKVSLFSLVFTKILNQLGKT